MAKFGLQKGDKIITRSRAEIDENTFKKIGGHVTYEKPFTVVKVWDHGVRTKEMGYFNNNLIVGKVL